MPVITVFGLPADTNEQALQELYTDCVDNICGVNELKLSDQQITFFFPVDMMMFGLGKEIVVFVDGLFVKPERTDEVLARLAHALGATVRSHFPNALVEVFCTAVRPRSWVLDIQTKRGNPPSGQS